jgi:hypothetical protein
VDEPRATPAADPQVVTAHQQRPRSSTHAGGRHISPDPIEDAIAFWEPRLGRSISREEAREIVDNLLAFFRLLLEFEHRDCGTRRRPVPQADEAA